MELIEKSARELKLQIMNFWTHKKILNPVKPSISKIEQVTEIFVSQVEAKSKYCQIFKTQNLIQFFRFGPDFLHVSSISREVQPLNSI